MFILYAIVAGLVVGWLSGGRLEQLGNLHLRWVGAAIGGLAIQLVLFAGPVASAVASAPEIGLVAYVGSTALVLAAVIVNLRVRPLAIVAAGAILNGAAIVANGGIMPTTLDALAAAGSSPPAGFSNSAVVANPALPWLIDRFALPAWLPLANVFSIGDVLIAVGIGATIAGGMRVPHLDQSD